MKVKHLLIGLVALSLFSTPMKILFEFNVFQIDPRVREIQCLNKSALKHC